VEAADQPVVVAETLDRRLLALPAHLVQGKECLALTEFPDLVQVVGLHVDEEPDPHAIRDSWTPRPSSLRMKDSQHGSCHTRPSMRRLRRTWFWPPCPRSFS